MNTSPDAASPIAQEIAARRAQILGEIAQAATAIGRDPASIELTAVSKVQPEERVDAMLAAGQRVFGENRVQEAEKRWTARRLEFPDLQLRLIGPLQSNKADDAVKLFDVIETVDRPKIVHALATAMDKQNKHCALFVQINTGEEPQKSGLTPRDADAFIKMMADDYSLPPVGVMCIPPADEPAGPHFALLKAIADRNGLSQVSMGMSQDFQTAIRFGATHVRVGSALFGERVQPA